MGSVACWIILEEKKKSRTLSLVPVFDYWIRFIWCLLNHKNKHPSVSSVRFPCSCPWCRAFCSVPVCRVKRAALRLASDGTQHPATRVTAAKQPGSPDVPAEHTTLLLIWRFTDACGKGDRCEALASWPSSNSSDLRGIVMSYIYSDVWKWALEKSIKLT